MGTNTVDLILKARDEFSATYRQLEQVLDKTAKASDALNKTFGNTTKGAEQAKEAMEGIGQASKGIDRMATALDSLITKTAALNKLQAEAATLKEKINQVTAAIEAARSSDGDPVIRKHFLALTEAAKKTQQAIKDTTQRLKEMQSASDSDGLTISPAAQAKIEKLSKSLEALEQDYRIISREAEKAGVALRESLGPPPKGLQQELNKLNGALARTQARIETTAASANKLQQELNEAGVDTADLSVAQQRLAGTAGQLTARKKELASAIDKARGAQNRSNDISRTALGVTQGLRGQVLSLISAYVGLYGVARQVGEVFSASSREAGIEMRLGVALDGDEQAVGQAMKFLREEADRLKVSFLGAGENFSKFATALPEGKYALEDLKKVFTGFNTAGAVLGLSNEQIDRVFYALTQIAGKGAVQMEELRQQIGEAMPTALNLFAEAAGFGSDRLSEFFKAVTAGEVGSDVIFKVAELMIEKYGGDLPEALKKPAAALRSFQLQVELLQLEIGRTGFIQTLTSSLRELTEVLKDPGTREDLKAFAAGIGQVIEWGVALAPHLKTIIGLFITMKAIQMGAWVTTIVTGFRAANGGAVALNRTLPSLIANLKKLSAAQILIGGPTVAITGWSAVQVYDLVAGMLEAERTADGNKEAIARLRKEYQALFTELESGTENLKGKSLESLEEIRKKALEAMAKAIEEQQRQVNANQLGPLKQIIQSLAGGLVDLRPFDNESIAEAGRLIETAKAKLAEINAEIATRPDAPDLGLLNNAELQNTSDNVTAYTQALMNLENANIDDTILRLNQAFEAQRQGLEEAGLGVDAYLAHERDRVNTVVALEEYRRDRIIQIASQEAQARLELLAQQGTGEQELSTEQRKIATELANFRVSEAQRAQLAIGKELDNSIDREQGYAKAVKSIRQTLANEISTQSDQGFQSAIGGESPFVAYQALQDRRLEIARTTAAAERALEQGNYTQAEELARKRKELAQSIGDVQIENAKTGGVLVKQGESRLSADLEINAANEQIQKALQGQEKAAIAAQKQQGELTKELEKSATAASEIEKNAQKEVIQLNAELDTDGLTEELTKIKIEAGQDPLILALELDDKTARLQLAELQKPTQSIHTVKLVVDNSAIPAGAIGRAQGGPVPGLAGGGKINGPGTSTSDSILARLSRGEYVIKAAAVDFWGEDLMRRINSMSLPAFAEGGAVLSYNPATAPAPTSKGRVVTHRIYTDDRLVGEVTGDDDVVDKLINSLRRLK